MLKKLIALAVLFVLAAIYWAALWPSDPYADADVAKARAEIKALNHAVKAYMLQNDDKVPDSLESVAPYMYSKRIPKDPWGNLYVITKEGSRDFKIVSYGEDGTPGGRGRDADLSSEY